MNERFLAKGFPRFRDGLLVTPPPQLHLRPGRPVPSSPFTPVPRCRDGTEPAHP